MSTSKIDNAPALPRVVGVGGAVFMGLGSIVGTGVFVTIGIAAGLAGPAVILAIAVAAVIATANGLSSAQLAANHPVSGGTYEYGYRLLTPALGFTAGWLFLCAKSASAATAALGFAHYLALASGLSDAWSRPVALLLIALLTLLTLAGLKRSNRANLVIVATTLATLVLFILLCMPRALQHAGEHLSPFFASSRVESPFLPAFLESCALMFVAYTGYGRIATLGEEIREPRRNIPRAMILTLLVSMLLYIAVAAAGIAAVGVEAFTAPAGRAAPLEHIATLVSGPWAGRLLTLGAATAMVGVLLNLLLGLSRVALAMARRNDLPAPIARLDAAGASPANAILLVAFIIAGLTLIGDVKTTWSFSAFTVLLYYAITNLAALRLPREERLYPRWIAVVGLIGCAFLAFWVQPRIWLTGLGIIVIGLMWHRWRSGDKPTNAPGAS